MSGITVIYLVAMFFCFYKGTTKKIYIRLLSLTMVVEILNLNGYFFKMGELVIGCQFISEIILIAYTIYYCCVEHIKVKKRLIYLSALFMLIILVGIVYEIMFPYDGLIINQNGSWDLYYLGLEAKQCVDISYVLVIMLFIKSFGFVLQLCIIKSSFEKEDFIVIIKKVIYYLKIDVYVGCVEFFIKSILYQNGIWEIMTGAVLGNVAYGGSVLRNDMVPLCGLEKEPAHFVATLFILAVLISFYRKIKDTHIIHNGLKYSALYYIVIILLMFMSGGFSAFWYVLMLLICNWIINGKDRCKRSKTGSIVKYILSIIVLIYFVTYIYSYMLILDNDIGQKTRYVDTAITYILSSGFVLPQYASSALSRFGSIYETFLDFVNRPIFGLGIGVQTCHDGLVNILSDIGIGGLILLVILMKYKVKKSTKYDMVLFLFYLFVVNLPLGLRSMPYEVYNVLLLEITSLYMTKQPKINIIGE